MRPRARRGALTCAKMASAPADRPRQPAPAGRSTPAPAGRSTPAPSGMQTGEGRIAVSTWNFGDVQRRRQLKAIAAENLATMAASIQCAQEVTRETHNFICAKGWTGTPRQYAKRQPGASGSSAPAEDVDGVGSGLGVFAKDTVASSVEVLEDCSFFPRDGEKWPSPIMAAKATFHMERCGFKEFAVVNTHMHRMPAKGGESTSRRSAPAGTRYERKKYFNQLAYAIATSRARILVGDLNMSLFSVSAELSKRGVLATLLCHHVELNDDMDPLYDSCGFPYIHIHLSATAAQVSASVVHTPLCQRRVAESV